MIQRIRAMVLNALARSESLICFSRNASHRKQAHFPGFSLRLPYADQVARPPRPAVMYPMSIEMPRTHWSR